MSERVLITGGAGFIGSHLADELLEHGYQVRALDNLSDQVHGLESGRPGYLNPDVELVEGDVRDPEAVRKALEGVDAVYHYAARVGVGQSMYEIEKYTSVNNLGTAVLLEALVEKPVRRLIVASSMSIYGEGLYVDGEGRPVLGQERGLDRLKAHDWEVRDGQGQPLTPVPTPESKTPCLSSVYALSKYDQERMCLMVGRAYSIPTVALRFFNVYGTRQALSNPYTGVLAIFASRLLNGNPPLIFEDGYQMRDFVHVSDVARASRLALEIARAMAEVLGRKDVEPEVTGKYRMGDIRHCFADITMARRVLGYEPQMPLERGLIELSSWLEGQVATDRAAQAGEELAARGLTV
jgi:dTDP-L-rhamnose 4-epimerase